MAMPIKRSLDSKGDISLGPGSAIHESGKCGSERANVSTARTRNKQRICKRWTNTFHVLIRERLEIRVSVTSIKPIPRIVRLSVLGSGTGVADGVSDPEVKRYSPNPPGMFPMKLAPASSGPPT